MTRKTKKSTDKQPKKLSLSKKTLKDLTVRGKGPMGGGVNETRHGSCTCAMC